MSVIESPTDPLVQMQVDPTFQAARGSLLPREYNQPLHPGGHHKGSFRTGNTTIIAAGGAIFSMRWTNAQYNFLLQKLDVTAFIGTVFGAAQELSVDLVRVINFSAADTGGTALDPLLKQTIKDTEMASSQIQTLRVATTGALTPGTGTAEVTPISEDALPLSTVTLGSVGKVTLHDMRPGEQTPQVFRANEGFRVRILQTMGAAGVVVWHFNMEWAEVPTF